MNIRVLLIGVVTFMLILTGCGNNQNDNNENSKEPSNQIEENNNEDHTNDKNNNNDENVNNAGAEDNDGDEENNASQDGSESNAESLGQISYMIPKEAIEMEIEEQEMPVVLYMLEESTGTSFNIVEEKLPEEMELTLDEYMGFALDSAEAAGIEFESSENFDMDGKEWNEVVGQNQGFPLMQRAVIYNNVAYVFTLSSGSQESFEKYVDTFRDITASVEQIGN